MISYGGISLLPSPPAGLMLSPAEVFGFFRPKAFGDLSLDPRTHFAWILERGVRLNTFFNPWGASRFGVAYVLTHQAGLDAIRAQVYGVDEEGEYEDEYNALEFLIDDQVGDFSGGTSSFISTDLYMLPAIPLAREPITIKKNVPDVGQQMYLLVLVDERYFWWEKAAEIEVDEGTTTWADLFGDLATALGIALTQDAIDAAYLKPSNRFTQKHQYLPLLLDLAAASVGQRVVRRLDGTFHAIGPSTAEDVVAENQDSAFVELAGGPIEDARADVPENVTVAFPRMNNPESNPLLYTKEINLADLALEDFADEAGHEGQRLIHSEAVAPLQGEEGAVNQVQLDALAERIATDFYRWRTGWIHVLYRTAAAWLADGIHDIEWRHDGTMDTHVRRSEWEPEFGELAHAGEFGSRHGLQFQAATKIKLWDDRIDNVCVAPVNGVFRSLIQSRDNDDQEFEDGPAVWAKHLNPRLRVVNDITTGGMDEFRDVTIIAKYQFISPLTGDYVPLFFNAVYCGIEPAGERYISTEDDNTGGTLGQSGLPMLYSDPDDPYDWNGITLVDADITAGSLALDETAAPLDFQSTLTLVVTGAVDAFITIIGTNLYGNLIGETVEVEGADTYTTGLLYRTITSIKASRIDGTGHVVITVTEVPPGVLRAVGPVTFLSTVPTTGEPGVSADWLEVEPSNQGGFSLGTTYSEGQYVQEVRALYSFEAPIVHGSGFVEYTQAAQGDSFVDEDGNVVPWFRVPDGVYEVTVEITAFGGYVFFGGDVNEGIAAGTPGTNGGGGAGGGATARASINVFPGQALEFETDFNVYDSQTSVNIAQSHFTQSSILVAKGGKNHHSTVDELNGAAGGSADECIGTIRFSGGDGATGWRDGSDAAGGGGGGGANWEDDGDAGEVGSIAGGGAGGDGSGDAGDGGDGDAYIDGGTIRSGAGAGEFPGGGAGGEAAATSLGLTLYGGGARIRISWGDSCCSRLHQELAELQESIDDITVDASEVTYTPADPDGW